MKIEAEVNALINAEWYAISDLAHLAAGGQAGEIVDALAFYSQELTAPYVVVGRARITVEFDSPDALVQAQVSALKAARDKKLAEMQAALEQYDERIRNLQALTHDPAVQQDGLRF